MKRFGFTLAEVLITLVIIGVIAAMTIPTLMNNTNQQEFRVGLKKAVSALNQAMSLNYALEGTTVGDSSLATTANVRDNLFKKRMSIVSTGTSGVTFASPDSVTADTNGILYTADGMRFAIGSGANYGNTGLGNVDDEIYYGYIIIDVNGEKGPNVATASSTYPRDTYVVTMFGNRVMAGKVGVTNGTSLATREVLFDKQSATTAAQKQ